jgi:hypothetical protein
MEGEPVFRHVGGVQRERRDHGDNRPVYGLFIAERLTPTIITDFFARHRIPTTEFAGAVCTVPLAVEDFRKMLVTAKDHGAWSGGDLHRFFRRVVQLARIAPDEAVWHVQVRQLAANWLDDVLASDRPLPDDLLTRYAEQQRIMAQIQDQMWSLEAR